MRLFAERGAAEVTIRDIAAGAGVSPSLVIHHYGSKEGLRAAVDERATALVEMFVKELTEHAGDGERRRPSPRRSHSRLTASRSFPPTCGASSLKAGRLRTDCSAAYSKRPDRAWMPLNPPAWCGPRPMRM